MKALCKVFSSGWWNEANLPPPNQVSENFSRNLKRDYKLWKGCVEKRREVRSTLLWRFEAVAVGRWHMSLGLFKKQNKMKKGWLTACPLSDHLWVSTTTLCTHGATHPDLGTWTDLFDSSYKRRFGLRCYLKVKGCITILLLPTTHWLISKPMFRKLINLDKVTE